MVWGCVLGLGLSHLVPVKRTLNSLAGQEILDKFMLPTMWEQLDVSSYVCEGRRVNTLGPV